MPVSKTGDSRFESWRTRLRLAVARLRRATPAKKIGEASGFNDAMKLVFIYGPPAVGKLTVAGELSKLTGYKVFHNHLTIDLVESIFEWGTKVFIKLINRYRLELIEAAAKQKINLIFTFVYAKTYDDKFVKEIVTKVKKHGGKVCFARLHCSKAELARRLKHPARERFSKMKKLQTLKEVMRKYDLFSSVSHANNLVIDNTSVPPKAAAWTIKKHFGLGKFVARPTRLASASRVG